MLAWRFTAAAAALCLFASASAAVAHPANSHGTSAHYKKHRVAHDERIQKSAVLRRSRRLTQRRRSDRVALHHHHMHHLARRFDTSRPAEVGSRDFVGTASYYWEGSRVATGAHYNPDGLTAAHRTLPFGTRLRVTDLISNRSVVVTVNDRGPFVGGRVLDLSRGAAQALGMIGRGVTRIRASVI
jgi:rare lipoprotein A